jgi:uncharacterized protein DUF1634
MMQTKAERPITNPPDADTAALAPVYGAAIATLRYGFFAAAALFLTGLIWSAAAREDISENVTPIEKVPGQLADGTPMAMVDLAFLVLMFTPVVTVLRVGMVFLRLGDSRFGILSLGVLAILGTSITIALLR